MDESETRENTPSLEDRLVGELKDWIRRTGPRLHCADRTASITFTLFAGETQFLDDDTPFLDARVSEEVQTDELGGWIIMGDGS